MPAETRCIGKHLSFCAQKHRSSASPEIEVFEGWSRTYSSHSSPSLFLSHPSAHFFLLSSYQHLHSHCRDQRPRDRSFPSPLPHITHHENTIIHPHIPLHLLLSRHHACISRLWCSLHRCCHLLCRSQGGHCRRV